MSETGTSAKQAAKGLKDKKKGKSLSEGGLSATRAKSAAKTVTSEKDSLLQDIQKACYDELRAYRNQVMFKESH
jgi:hypothetical protein